MTFPLLWPHVTLLGVTQPLGGSLTNYGIQYITDTQSLQSEQANRSLLERSSGWRTQSTVRQTKECGTAASLLVIKHDVWFPDLLCGDTHELHPLVVGGFPFQLVVIPDLVEGGRRQWKDQPGSLSPDTASWSLWGQPPPPHFGSLSHFPATNYVGPREQLGGSRAGSMG